ncbi:MAG TPA: gamma carbonic anhydrase family protein, partial [Campylobacterales bacterium]|nr:gamma carbonic anhydrase family protein [Campylobacterales bacterium]
MLINYKHWRPELKKGAWIAQGSTVIGRTTMGEDSAVW